ncbi:MAG: hypothetical protein HY319_19230 [Armatimonadetes bacterium]|nr:hypothetical protein [Armatimonadota bacterium]
MPRRFLFSCALAGLLLGGCQQAPSPAPAPSTPTPAESSPAPQTDARGEALRLAQEAGDVSNRRRAELLSELLSSRGKAPVQAHWDAVAADKPGEYRVALELRKGKDTLLRGEWVAVPADSRATASNDFAKRLELLAVRLDPREATALLPGTVAVQEQPAAAVPVPAAPAPVPAPAPAPPAPAPAPARGSGQVHLVGLMTGDIQKAILQVDGKHYTVGLGESAGGYELVSIAPGVAVVAQGGQTVQLNLDSPKARPRPSAPATAPQKPPGAAASRKPVELPGSVEPEPGQEVKVLNNASLDDSPPIELEGGWRKFETGEE